jgi:hypothetical protein
MVYCHTPLAPVSDPGSVTLRLPCECGPPSTPQLGYPVQGARESHRAYPGNHGHARLRPPAWATSRLPTPWRGAVTPRLPCEPPTTYARRARWPVPACHARGPTHTTVTL